MSIIVLANSPKNVEPGHTKFDGSSSIISKLKIKVKKSGNLILRLRKVGARSGQKARFGQGLGKLAAILMFFILITPPCPSLESRELAENIA